MIVGGLGKIFFIGSNFLLMVGEN